MIETQEDLDFLLADGQAESHRDRIRRYVEKFIETLPEDRRKDHPLYGPTKFRRHQTVAFFHWMKEQGKEVKIMIGSLSYGRNPLFHVCYKDGSVNFISRNYYDSSESARGKASFLSFEFFDTPEEVTPVDFPHNFMEGYDPKFWEL